MHAVPLGNRPDLDAGVDACLCVWGGDSGVGGTPVEGQGSVPRALWCGRASQASHICALWTLLPTRCTKALVLWVPLEQPFMLYKIVEDSKELNIYQDLPC